MPRVAGPRRRRSSSSASILADLDGHRRYLDQAWHAAQAAPLSARKAMLVAALIDAFVDHQFAADAAWDDILEYRAARAARSQALGWIMDLCSQRRVQLVTEAVPVPISQYERLSVEDFMVSLYNDHSVQRLRLVLPGGERVDMQQALAAAIEDLDEPFRD